MAHSDPRVQAAVQRAEAERAALERLADGATQLAEQAPGPALAFRDAVAEFREEATDHVRPEIEPVGGTVGAGEALGISFVP
ncbi:MAG: hypothetical protein CMN31_08605 [Sandaracinus sp.]|nr:hypothetical protein [Sandaracinus sp.]|tara:strand:+ start:84 stop:329 length:246 start_codon:yes stop_codon:yes gene_type:complete